MSQEKKAIWKLLEKNLSLLRQRVQDLKILTTEEKRQRIVLEMRVEKLAKEADVITKKISKLLLDDESSIESDADCSFVELEYTDDDVSVREVYEGNQSSESSGMDVSVECLQGTEQESLGAENIANNEDVEAYSNDNPDIHPSKYNRSDPEAAIEELHCCKKAIKNTSLFPAHDTNGVRRNLNFHSFLPDSTNLDGVFEKKN